MSVKNEGRVRGVIAQSLVNYLEDEIKAGRYKPLGTATEIVTTGDRGVVKVRVEHANLCQPPAPKPCMCLSGEDGAAIHVSVFNGQMYCSECKRCLISEDKGCSCQYCRLFRG